MTLHKKTKFILSILCLIVTIAIVLYLNRPESDARLQSTDDAYVQADFTVVSPQVSGNIVKVYVRDNQYIKQGQLLATIDDRDFVIALNIAKAQVISAQASIKNLQAHLAQQELKIQQAKIVTQTDEETLKLAKINAERYRNLARDGSGTVQAMQQADTQLNIQQANLIKSKTNYAATQQQTSIIQADLEKAEATLSLAKAAQSAAELKLSYTKIYAPVNGIIGQKTIRVGSYANTGKPLLAIVPLDSIYILANYRETQLAHVAIGQTVDIRVDALPGHTFTGVVESIAPASGNSYAAVAPSNATGNFTKIVQRLPVHIHLTPNQPEQEKLKVGMSAITTIYTE
ncbi:HlyD family secretion protein [uncultured Cedecea sp.]|uniref:HlyD family secretion protein n=1 Tax=uncultured Cedecea sp. TaxID=988762 RepID=UPI0026115D52|nr:HlyD family secretion protein [uncultured Cedecea sp.]